MRYTLVIATLALACVGCREETPLRADSQAKAQERERKLDDVPKHLLAPPAPSYQFVSLVTVLGQPERFDGKAIQVIGFGHLRPKGKGLYIHRADFEQGIDPNSLELSLDATSPEFSNLEDSYVVVSGVFKANPQNSDSLQVGWIEQISSYGVWPSREELRREVERSRQQRRK